MQSQRRRLMPVLALLLLMPCIGCELPAQMEWSPDGRRAAYRSQDRLVLLDESGKVLQELGDSVGGYAWSLDSRALYFAAKAADNTAITSFNTQWLPEALQEHTPSTSPAASADASCHVLQDGKVTPLFHLRDAVMHMTLSLDGRWLAVLTIDEDQENETSLYVYSLVSQKLYLLSKRTALGVAFADSNTLVFIEPISEEAKFELVAQMVEVTLSDHAEQMPRKRLLDVLGNDQSWIRAIGTDVMLSAPAITLPGRNNDPESFKLHHFTRGDNGLSAVADSVGALFAPSPDGKLILFEQIVPQTPAQPEKSLLCVMNSNGSDVRVLRDLSNYPSLPMWPAWRGNGQVAFVTPAEAGQQMTSDPSRMCYDVVLYQLEQGGLRQVRVLSQGWDETLKPSVKANRAATAPATLPSPVRDALLVQPATVPSSQPQ